MFDEAEYIAAVSGGNYIAAAHLITAGRSDKELLAHQAPVGPGSPEERNFRNHSTYLAGGLGGRLWFLLNLVYGMVVNFIPFFVGAVLAGRLLGWFYADLLQPDLKSGDKIGSLSFPWWTWLWAGLTGLLAFTLVVVRRYNDRTVRAHREKTATFSERWSVHMILAGMWATFLLILMPIGIHAFRAPPWDLQSFRDRDQKSRAIRPAISFLTTDSLSHTEHSGATWRRPPASFATNLTQNQTLRLVRERALTVRARALSQRAT